MFRFNAWVDWHQRHEFLTLRKSRSFGCPNNVPETFGFWRTETVPETFDFPETVSAVPETF
jgi:hypothetical protein